MFQYSHEKTGNLAKYTYSYSHNFEYVLKLIVFWTFHMHLRSLETARILKTRHLHFTYTQK